MLSLPTFVAGPLLVLVFAVTLHVFPATGFNRLSQGLGPNLKSVILPSVALAIGSIAIYYRLLRADLIATLQEDFVTMARAKGLSTRYILMRHVLRPSSFSLLAGAGISIGSLFTGAFVVEVLFQLPGHRLPARPGHLLPRLPGGPGHGPGGRRRLRGHQLRGRLPPHRPRPAGAPCLTLPSQAALESALVERGSGSRGRRPGPSPAGSPPRGLLAKKRGLGRRLLGLRWPGSCSWSSWPCCASVLPLKNPNFQDYSAVNVGPSVHHLLGTDDLGRDLLARVIFGSRVSLVIGFAPIAHRPGDRGHPRAPRRLPQRRGRHRAQRRSPSSSWPSRPCSPSWSSRRSGSRSPC